MGYDLSNAQATIKPIQRVLAACREQGYLVIHTREGHRPNLSDLPANKQWRSEQIGAGIGSKGPCGRVLTQGEPGWEIIPELAPIVGEPIIDKPGKGSFYATDLELILRTRGIKNIILAGVTTDVCVHTTMRVANDMGFECVILEDCTAATDPANHHAALSMVKKQGGVFGAVSSSDKVVAAFKPGGHLEQPLVVANAPGVASIPANPYPYLMPIKKTALIMIDFQRDFMEVCSFAESLGNNVSLLQECVPAAKAMLAACREAGMTIVHTLEAHLPDLSDLHPSKYRRGNPPKGSRIGDSTVETLRCPSNGVCLGPHRLLVRGSPGNDLIPELKAMEGEKIIHKPGKGAFYSTDLDEYLTAKGITHLIFAGVTTEVCVQSSMREANDRGYECLLVTDATASYFPKFKESAIEMMVSQGGLVGWAAPSVDVLLAMKNASK
ncbi:hypothetical protein CEUSTIGMA_g13368.t1 [Chlamydomonas eustigma]|uniref:Isochorismatase-like domain-containing protein n=1 Tax=Chlamydomonas eustigma TaxID=1157962 RepID=A0A250XSP9_9CHLO|nr:hypothetical protein CEUSTIGMA_g13368.t1 [Chlamydomonas eustigma]|eukprot:GAX85952.1 hypothetical protein CEUSTIGMA_g13368.t1 [Chlamydomonas eustigma]